MNGKETNNYITQITKFILCLNRSMSLLLLAFQNLESNKVSRNSVARGPNSKLRKTRLCVCREGYS